MNQIPAHIKKTKRFRFFLKPLCVGIVIILIMTNYIAKRTLKNNL
jgi:hypothetical protein